MVFNNVTSLPLLLLESLGDTGTLKPLLGKGEDMDDLLSKGKVYLLIHALVCNLTRFAFGPCTLSLSLPFPVRSRGLSSVYAARSRSNHYTHGLTRSPQNTFLLPIRRSRRRRTKTPSALGMDILRVPPPRHSFTPPRSRLSDYGSPSSTSSDILPSHRTLQLGK